MNGDSHIAGLKPTDVALLKSVAEEAAERAVKKTFVAMGLDPEKPLTAQADMAFLRATRKRCEGVAGKIIITLVGLAVAGSVSVSIVGLKVLLTHP
jgi:hypothetical protein